ncbi:MAG: transcription antitermination protein NusB [Bacteroidales bacterium]
MLSRRLIRVKVFKILFSKIASGSESVKAAEKEMLASCEKTLDLYCFMLSLPVALRKVAEAKIEGGLKKFQPTAQEANPNRKFLDNKFIQLIEDDSKFIKLCESKGLIWVDYDTFVRRLYTTIVTKDYFKEYMESEQSSIKEDYALFRRIYEEEFEDNSALEDILEDMSIFWMDDLVYVVNAILKNMGSFEKKGNVIIPNVFLKEDDRAYAIKLLTRSMVNYDEYTEIVSGYIPNWDLERLVATDLALIVMGIAEALTFESIPLKVTINEFVDISKYYSTPNSKVFVNGLLDKILQQMLKEGKIIKSGRGLVGSLE